MRRLILLRHAKSDWSGETSDHHRPLAARGRAAAPAMGAYLAREGLIPDISLVSDARRTQETFVLVASCFSPALGATLEPRIYEAPSSRILTVIREIGATAQVAMLVGHNPGMAATALALTGHGDRYALARMRRKYPTCGVAVIDVPVESFADIVAGEGRLDRFVTPASLDPAVEDE